LIEAFLRARPNLEYLGTISFQDPRLAPRPSGPPSRYDPQIELSFHDTLFHCLKIRV